MNMDIDLNQKQLPPPEDIVIKYTKNQNQCILTWNKLFNVDDNKVHYNIYRSTAFTGSYFKINNVPIKGNRFVDNTRGNYAVVNYWYKISSLYKVGDTWIEGLTSKPVQYEVKNTNYWFNKINERNMWILKNDGMLVDHYARKYEGEYCECYDDVRAQAANAHCPICYGTGIVGGYSPVCQIYLRVNISEISLLQAVESYDLNWQVTAWTITSIPIYNRDLLIFENTIFSVTSVTQNRVAGYYFHQDLRLKSLYQNDPLYNMRRVNLKPVY